MLPRFKELPAEKEKRILVSGEGQEALLVTHYLARSRKLRESVPNIKIYCVNKSKKPEECPDDFTTEVEPIGKLKFWLGFARHQMS